MACLQNQCGHATSAAFTLPAGVAKARFLIGGGADAGGVWVYRASDDAELCSFVGPDTCPMTWEECDFSGDVNGTVAYMKLEKPCSGSGGWENLLVDSIEFLGSDGTTLESPTCLPPPSPPDMPPPPQLPPPVSPPTNPPTEPAALPLGLHLATPDAKLHLGPNMECTIELKAGPPPYLESSCPIDAPPPGPSTPPPPPPPAAPPPESPPPPVSPPPPPPAVPVQSVYTNLDPSNLINGRWAGSPATFTTTGWSCGSPTEIFYELSARTFSGAAMDNCIGSLPDHWWRYQFSSSSRITSYRWIVYDFECPAAWTVQGSNDATNYDEVSSESGQVCNSGNWQNYTTGSTTAYTYWRWKFSAVEPPTGAIDGYRWNVIEFSGY